MVGKDLELRLKEAEATAEKAHGDLAIVERKIAEARAAVNGADKRRQVHALAAATGDAKASAALAKIKKETAEVEQDLTDLQAALPEARRRVAAADQAVAQARAEIGRAEMNSTIRRRVEVAKEIDRIAAEFDVVAQRYLALGHELENAYHEVMAARGYEHSVTNAEAVHGLQRLINAMPQLTRRLFPTEIRLSKQRVNLAAAECAFFGLPADEEDGKGAAAA